MITTIDMAGRVVIPKPIRDQMGLVPGAQLAIEERLGRIEITPVIPQAELVEINGRLVIQRPPDSPTIEDDDIQRLIEEARFERVKDFLK